jgi:hypothetical protein
LEKSVLASAEALQQRRELLPTYWTEEAIARHPRLTGEQTEALRHLCATRGGLTLIHGLAGTGKSTLFAVAQEVWTQQGLSVYGAAWKPSEMLGTARLPRASFTRRLQMAGGQSVVAPAQSATLAAGREMARN